MIQDLLCLYLYLFIQYRSLVRILKNLTSRSKPGFMFRFRVMYIKIYFSHFFKSGKVNCSSFQNFIVKSLQLKFWKTLFIIYFTTSWTSIYRHFLSYKHSKAKIGSSFLFKVSPWHSYSFFSTQELWLELLTHGVYCIFILAQNV